MFLLKFFFCSFIVIKSTIAQVREVSYNNIVKLNVLESFYTFTFPTLQFAYEYNLNSKIAIIPELGIQINDFPRYYLLLPYDNEFVKPSGIKGLIEGRYYLKTKMKKKSLHRFALGLNVFYRYNTGNAAINYYQNNDTSVLLTDGFWYSKNVLGTNFLATVQFIRKKGWTFEIYSGMGALYRKVQENEMEYNFITDKLIRHHHQFYPNPFLSENNGWKYSFIVGFKFGYAFLY